MLLNKVFPPLNREDRTFLAVICRLVNYGFAFMLGACIAMGAWVVGQYIMIIVGFCLVLDMLFTKMNARNIVSLVLLQVFFLTCSLGLGFRMGYENSDKSVYTQVANKTSNEKALESK